MLVLTRKLGEGIAIGDDIKIVVMQIKGKQVRLGIKASPHTIVHREEVYQKIHDENKLASGFMAKDTLSQASKLLTLATDHAEKTGQVRLRKKLKASNNNNDTFE